MAECEIPLPCSSTISSFDTAFEIINTGRGGAVRGIQDNPIPSDGVYGSSRGGIGVRGICRPNGTGVVGASESDADSPATGNGVHGSAHFGIGVLGTSVEFAGVSGEGGKFGVHGASEAGNAGFFEIEKDDNNKTVLHAHTRVEAQRLKLSSTQLTKTTDQRCELQPTVAEWRLTWRLPALEGRASSAFGIATTFVRR
jgi:hypothetical protein